MFFFADTLDSSWSSLDLTIPPRRIRTRLFPTPTPWSKTKKKRTLVLQQMLELKSKFNFCREQVISGVDGGLRLVSSLKCHLNQGGLSCFLNFCHNLQYFKFLKKKLEFFWRLGSLSCQEIDVIASKKWSYLLRNRVFVGLCVSLQRKPSNGKCNWH